MSNVVIISGSTSSTSRLNGVLQQVEALLHDHKVERIDVRSLPPEDLIYTKFDSPAIIEANRLIEQADAVVVATPIYKASYTGVLKTFLDLIPQKGLQGKVILPIAIGGTIAHLLAIDYALKPVLSSLGANNQLQGVYAQDVQVNRAEDGSFELTEELHQRLQESVQQFEKEIQALLQKSPV
ncbi:NADPH-dependent FMN reductase [Paenibacillus validus]|uniref:NADPH-dependent FMN reductase n=1 Tax=Paenibacillus validus TaxID=44253 RepID=A0A7X3CRB2_9BACL|nr:MULTISPECIES: NADPH-dependent FMN reductase [Paenibacillus]MED4601622.1 NADPH-dependent FMN reductase [Paenibacillus validus]MED4605635.1 NADPH-dependent FMN reductase [Paenibacillus validus]MUG70027.1 NADPH-dependent FMN reductase [Paenibacillus validus]